MIVCQAKQFSKMFSTVIVARDGRHTLSYYDSILREMIRLATMECPFENHKCCELFFKTINRIVAEYAKDEGRFQDATFNPFHLKDDENGAN